MRDQCALVSTHYHENPHCLNFKQSPKAARNMEVVSKNTGLYPREVVDNFLRTYG